MTVRPNLYKGREMERRWLAGREKGKNERKEGGNREEGGRERRMGIAHLLISA